MASFIDDDSTETVDAWPMGHAWLGSKITEVMHTLCQGFGTRWAGTAADKKAAEFIRNGFETRGMSASTVEAFDRHTWDCERALLTVANSMGESLPIRPCLFSPSASITAHLVDVGFGMDGVVLQFPELRPLVQQQLDELNKGLHWR